MRPKIGVRRMVLLIQLSAIVASFVLAPPHKSLLPARSVITMQENPLAKFFGGDGKSKKKGGALSNGLDELTRNAPTSCEAGGRDVEATCRSSRNSHC